MIPVASGEEFEIFAAINRAKEAGVQNIESVGGAWIGVDFAEIPGALTEAQVVVDFRPALAAILRLEDATFLGLDDRVDPIGIRA